jgi:hypothetical protein
MTAARRLTRTLLTTRATNYMEHCLVCVRSRYGDNNLVNMFGGRSCGSTLLTTRATN